MITIINKTKSPVVDHQWLHTIIQKMLQEVGYEDFDIGLLLTTNKTIQRYNREHRNKDKPTDILSFPYHPTLQAGERIAVEHPEDKNLGDIIISLEYVKVHASEWNRTFEEHLRALLAHGVAHLLGYDHQTDDQERCMHIIEQQLIKITL